MTTIEMIKQCIDIIKDASDYRKGQFDMLLQISHELTESQLRFQIDMFYTGLRRDVKAENQIAKLRMNYPVSIKGRNVSIVCEGDSYVVIVEHGNLTKEMCCRGYLHRTGELFNTILDAKTALKKHFNRVTK